MKKWIICSLALAYMVQWAACNNDDETGGALPAETLVVPRLVATETLSLYNGYLEVWPCYAGTSEYFGNYNTTTGALWPVYATYVMEAGVPAASGNSPVCLPIGSYTMLYWGMPTKLTYAPWTINEPAMRIGAQLSESRFTLDAIQDDTTYYPAVEMVHAMQDVKIGTDTLYATLQRVTAAFSVLVQNQDGTSLDASIDTMWVHISGISSALNAYSAMAESQTVTVAVPLAVNANNTQWSCANVPLFPSGNMPLMKLFVNLENGTQKLFQQYLSHSLSAGTLTTVTLLLGGALSTENETGTFRVVDWKEQTDSISVPLF